MSTGGFRTDEINEANLTESTLFSKGQRYRFQEQCFLHFWKTHIFKELHGQGRHIYILNPGEEPTPSGIPPQSVFGPLACGKSEFPGVEGKEVPCEPVFAYDHITSIISPNPATTVSQFNKLSGAEIFFRLDSSILTQLKPEIRLYKIYPSVDEKTGSPDKIRYKVPMPLGENIMADLEGIPSHGDISSIEKLFHDQNRLGNVMLTDLSFKFAGKNAALLNTVENVRFSLSFSSFDLFNHEFTTQLMHSDDLSTKDANEEEPVTWSYKDLISYSTKFMKSSISIDSPTLTDLNCFTSADKFVNEAMGQDLKMPNRKYFEIQMAVRYNPDDIDWEMVRKASAMPVLAKNKKGKVVTKVSTTGMGLTEDEQEELALFLRNSTIMLRLQFVAHTIKYNAKSSGADPELIIDFEYKAFIEGSLNNPELDIFNLNARERKLADIENRLEQARRLLIGVSRGKKTLGSIFGADGALEGNVAGSFNQQYRDLRSWLQENAGDLSYLIWSPELVAKPQGLANIIPTKAHLESADDEAAKRQATPGRGPGKMPGGGGGKDMGVSAKQWTQIKRGLGKGGNLDPDDPDTLLASTGAAENVFSEMVNKIRNYLRSYRRAQIGEKYKNIFQYLWKMERVYGLEVAQVKTSLGFSIESSEPNVQPEKTTAVHRKKVLEEAATDSTEYVKFQPKNIKVVRANVEESDIEKLIKKFKETTISAKGENEYDRADDVVKTMAQKMAKILGSEELSQPAGGSKNIVYFTTLGDLLDIAITIASFPSFGTFSNKIGYLLGPLIENDRTLNAATGGKKEKRRVLFNLAWVPISLKSLMGFFAKNVIATGKERYFLGDFIKDIIRDLILPTLGSRCVEDSLEGNEEVGTITFTTEMRENPNKLKSIRNDDYPHIPPFWPQTRNKPASQVKHYPPGGSNIYGLSDGGIIYDLMRSKTFTDDSGKPVNTDKPMWGHWERGSPGMPMIPWQRSGFRTVNDLTVLSPDISINKQFNYMFIYVNNYLPTNLDPTNEAKNISNGIYYLRLGKIPSIARGASFTKENITYLREARAMGQITRTGGMALKDVYRFSCNMYGNNIFKPGMLFFVDPTKDGSANYEQWKDLGIGGFYRVIEVDHSVNAGGDPSHTTNISAIWETFGSCGNDKGLLLDTKYLSIWYDPALAAAEAEE